MVMEGNSKITLFEESNLCTEGNDNENKARDENEVGDSVALCTLPSGEKELFGKNTDLYTDKNVMQCEPELPELLELLVCYKESGCHVIKDICVDEGTPFKDNNSTESGNGRGPNELNSSSGNDHDEDDAREFMSKEEVGDIELVIADALKKSLLENRFDNDIGNDGRSLDPIGTGEANNNNATDKVVDDDASKDRFVGSDMPLLRKLNKDKSLKSFFESPLHCDSDQVEQQSDQIPYSEAKYEKPGVVSATGESNKSPPFNNLSYNSKVESATIIFDFNTSKSAASCRGKNPNGVNCEPLLKIDSEPSHDNDGIPNSLAVGREVQHGQCESSFSMAGAVSGLITYSGQLAHSANVSLRSESSTTSTRSFAFPVLQSEWNSSPVRMAKADRRHCRKHRGWKQGLLCCRF
ncbi:hypothetical protein U1Q18_029381 [Sarracenia purpurea var. burkii]